MVNLVLVEPSSKYKNQYIEMIQEWKETGEKMVPFVLLFDHEDFDSLLMRLRSMRDDPMEDDKTVNCTTFWLLENNEKIVGAVNIRHRLNKYLMEVGGHIGYGIRPTARRKGYATELLKQALNHAKTLGISRALVTCDKNNAGSAKTIIKNNGVLDSEAVVDGAVIQRYWIDIN